MFRDRVILFAACGFAFLVAPARADVDPARVDATIAKAVNLLMSTQNADGIWDNRAEADGDGQYSGRTAVITYALLSAGMKSDPKLEKAPKYLLTVPPRGIYAAGMRAQVFRFYLGQPAYKKALRDEGRFLFNVIEKNPQRPGTFDYRAEIPGNRVDLSCTQFGVLGAWASADATETPTKFWQAIEAAYLKYQQPDGGWAYEGLPKPGFGTTNSLTCAGLATLYITQDFLHANEGLKPKGNIKSTAIDNGLAYLAKNLPRVFTVDYPHRYYTMYGLERVGVASGRRFIGDIDWYDAGANYLINNQAPNGAFNDDVDTAFAVLFLTYGRAPVVMAKLEYDTVGPNGKTIEGTWNQRPRDVANVVRFVAGENEKHLNWQIVRLGQKQYELGDTALLSIAGSGALSFKPSQLAELRRYIEEGGLIVANADGNSQAFAKSFKELGTQLFPGREWRAMLPTHPLFTTQQFRNKPGAKPIKATAIGNGVREFMILPDADMGREWQTRNDGRREYFDFISNLYGYVGGIDVPRFKGETCLVQLRPDAKPSKTIKVARLKYAGNWDPEPGAWRQLSQQLIATDKTAVETTTVDLTTQKIAGVKLAHLTGTGGIKLGTAERATLKEFLTGGGTLLVDSAGGDVAFAAAVEDQLRQLSPDDLGALDRPLSSTDPAAKGIPLADARFRLGMIRNTDPAGKKPGLRAASFNKRVAVYYTPQDLTAAMAGVPSSVIKGYDPNTARRLVAAIVLQTR